MAWLLTPLTLTLFLAEVPESPPPVGTRVADFTLAEPATKRSWNLAANSRNAHAVVIVFTSMTCPVCTAYIPRLTELAKRHAEDKVVWIAVASHAADDTDAVAAFAREAVLPFPILKDDGTLLANKLRVERVPTVIVLDGSRTVRYAGRIDDQFSPGVSKAKVETAELADALAAVVNNTEVTIKHTPAAGCRLTRDRAAPKPAATTTYHKNVAAILQSRCQECHRPGEAGPFPLTAYNHAKSWSAMIREVVADDVMPPWHADAPRGHFKNDRRLNTTEKRTLLDWIDDGCPEGNAADAPAPRADADGWRLGRAPDAVLRMEKAIPVPAHGTVSYEYVLVGDAFTEDKWLSGIEVRPEQRAVVHHIIAFLLPPNASLLTILGPDFGRHMLGAYVPGDQPIVAGPGQARKIPKGSKIFFEIHYTPNGRAVTDRSAIGLCYAKEPPTTELFALAAMNAKFRIPPGADNHEVKSMHTFPKAAVLLSVTPHMHVRGKAFRYETVTKEGKRATILNVPKYDFNWQASYDFAEPVTVPAGTRLECTAWYDNSTKNPFNPDPGKTIRFGNRTIDEMMIGFALYHDAK